MDRRVTRTGKDNDGDITKLCNPAANWSPRTKAGAIRDIENGDHADYVNETGSRTNVRVVSVNGKKHLRTTADSTSGNNLDNLPNC